MKIIRITNQYRRDFSAEIICEGCGSSELLKTGYDDSNYHTNVLPNMKCKACGKSRNDLGIKGDETQTKYPEGYQV